MGRYYYDFHIHSCLSPCGDDDNTPNNIAGMASLCGLDIVALCDHNTCGNCPAFFEAADRYGITAVAGMELTTAEDVHIICLFERLYDAMAFSSEVHSKRILVKNRADIFGNQFILDGQDNIIGSEENLLINATQISIEQLPDMVKGYGGICYPAHIDREANGIIAVLGTFPETPHFDCVELNHGSRKAEYCERYGLYGKRFLVGSDAHILTDMRDKENYFDLDCSVGDSNAVRSKLFEILRR